MKLVVRAASTLLFLVLAGIAAEVVTPRVNASVPSDASHPDASRAIAAASLPAVAPALPAAALKGSLTLSVATPAAVPAPAAAPAAPDAHVLPDAPADPADEDARWYHPTWFPDAPDLDAVADMGEDDPAVFSGKDGPGVRSRSVFIYDIDANQVLYEKNADVVRPVASLTKMVSALTLMSTNPNLDTELCIGAAQYPTRNGARSHLSTGDCIAGWDALGAALVASDNRAAYALAAVAGLDIDEFVTRMNEVSADLGMTSSTWSDPSGLEDENLSTARDIARATIAVSLHPVLSSVATAPFWDLHHTNSTSIRRLWSTDHVLGRDDVDVLAAKTGYTDTARYCFSTVLQDTSGRRFVVTLLGGEGKMTRWADIDRIVRWLDARAHDGVTSTG